MLLAARLLKLFGDIDAEPCSERECVCVCVCVCVTWELGGAAKVMGALENIFEEAVI